MAERQPLGIALDAATDAQLKAALHYLDERIDFMQVDRREIADEIDKRAREHRERIEALRVEQQQARAAGGED